MKIKYKQKGFTSTMGLTFENFNEVTVSKEIGEELIKQKHLFEEIKETKTEKTVEKPKQETKPKATKTTRAKSTKAQENK